MDTAAAAASNGVLGRTFTIHNKFHTFTPFSHAQIPLASVQLGLFVGWGNCCCITGRLHRAAMDRQASQRSEFFHTAAGNPPPYPPSHPTPTQPAASSDRPQPRSVPNAPRPGTQKAIAPAIAHISPVLKVFSFASYSSLPHTMNRQIPMHGQPTK